MAGTLTATTIQNDTSSPPTFRNNSVEVGTLCRAWVNFNGTGTVAIRASFNVSSITDNGTGDYTVNFTNAFSDANYAAILSIKDNSGSAPSISFRYSTGLYTTTQVQVQGWTYTGVQYDSLIVNVAVFR
jgi:hypothetical protein